MMQSNFGHLHLHYKTKVNEKELYWLAGHLDGEGSFGYQGGPRYSSFRVQSGSLDLDVMKRLQDLLGGGIYSNPQKYNGKMFHRWYLNGQPARQLMIDIYPLMSERRKLQIATAILANWQRPANAVKTHCVNGHPYTDESWVNITREHRRRRCIPCMKASNIKAVQKYRAKKRAERAK